MVLERKSNLEQKLKQSQSPNRKGRAGSKPALAGRWLVSLAVASDSASTACMEDGCVV